MIFVNLPVTDRDRADAFYGALGFRRNDQFSDERGVSYVVEENIHVMLLTRERFADFVSGAVGDPAQATSVLNCLSADSREEVDRLVSTAVTAGGKPWMPAQDHGSMYGSSFADPDGNVWEVMWMDPAALQG
ncbi:VOC family protein [Blastococcus capsensis]|uniref:VOC family protein n=1 Tax=Blastococcus capsensis TaxID=1564163 RepID=UPI002540FAD6|nr:VOC family protein [Blastococcus capsensis]MDK3257667.1 VOC family protein [Blastococcus capsensis]